MSAPLSHRPRSFARHVEETVDRHVAYIEAEATGAPLLRGGDGSGALYVVTVRILGMSDEVTAEINSTVVDVRRCRAQSALLLHRSPATGRLEVVGFSSRKPGSYRSYAVNLTTGVVGTPAELGLTTRPLTYEELRTIGGGYGTCPYGAVGVFRGSTLIRIGV